MVKMNDKILLEELLKTQLSDELVIKSIEQSIEITANSLYKLNKSELSDVTEYVYYTDLIRSLIRVYNYYSLKDHELTDMFFEYKKYLEI